jgi:alpha-ketoglutarate-dependent 2,4-dichlorophenoxyacetate dioxygenase
MDVRQIGPGFAAELSGIGLRDVCTSDEAYAAVRAAFEEHSVIVFRDQDVTDDVQAVYSRMFGPLELGKVGSLGHDTFYSRITNVDNEGRMAEDGGRLRQVISANQLWHTDSSFLAWPALASVLSARTVPESGGETEFTSTRLAWQRLSPEKQAQVRDLVVHHAYFYSRDQIDPHLMTPEQRAAMPAVRWRMTWPNPANGTRSLYIASHAGKVEGMGDNEGKALLDDLRAHATAEGCTYTHKWRPGDVVMWDNRATMHRGHPWPYDTVRRLIRTTIKARPTDGLTEVTPPAAVH